MSLNENLNTIKQNILISSANKSDISNLNNDITLRFPNKVFFKPPNFIQLINFDIKLEISTFGNTNNYMILTLDPDDNGDIKDYNVVPHFSPYIQDDLTLAAVFEAALNVEVTEFINPSLTEYPAGGGPNPEIPPVPDVNDDTYTGLSFACVYTTIEIIINNYNIEQDDSTSIFSISATRPVKLQFDVKDSIGPLMGFGNGIYNNVTNLEGTSVQSIEKYNSITLFNDSKASLNNLLIPFPNYNDINCKMELFDSTNTRILNLDNPGNPLDYINDPGDTTISLGIGGTSYYYTNMWDILEVLEIELNRYSSYFTPEALFRISYDYVNHKVTIENTAGSPPARWGFSFGFSQIDNGVRDTAGSLHKTLGFHQDKFIGQYSYTSMLETKAFDRIFAEDYILLCSDLIGNNSDRNVIGISNGNSIKSNNILFAIPLSLSNNFSPNEISNYTLNIESSNFSTGYKEQIFSDSSPAEISFYIRLLSGRHISSTCSWTALISFQY